MGYNRQQAAFGDFRDLVHRGGTPVTNIVLIANAVTFLTAFFIPKLGDLYNALIVFQTHRILQTPWTLAIHPLFTGDLISLLLCGYTFWWSGGSLERSWGSRTFLGFAAGLSVITALSIYAGTMLSPVIGRGTDHAAVLGLYLLSWQTIIAFCAIRPNQIISMIFCQVKAKYIALIGVAFTWYNYGPYLGLFACAGCLAAHLYVTRGRGYSGSGGFGSPSPPRGPDLRMERFDGPKRPNVTLDGSPSRPNPFDLGRILRERQERKRFEKLWNESKIPPAKDWKDDDRR